MKTVDSAIAYRQRPVRRAITLMVASIAVGVAVTIGIAWGFAWSAPAFSPPGIVYQGVARYEGEIIGFESASTERGIRRVSLFRWQGAQIAIPPGSIFSTGAELLPRWSIADRFEGDWKQDTPPRFEKLHVMEMATGWPWPTMVSRIIGEGDTPMDTRSVEGIAMKPRTPNFLNIPTVLPTTPLWFGFAASATLISLVVSMPALIGITRMRLRQRRGSCVRCGYDLRGTPSRNCPECGLNSERTS